MSSLGRHRRSRRVRFGRSLAAVSLALAGLVLAAAFVGLTVQGNAIAREIAGYRTDIVADQAQHDALAAQIADQKTADYVRQKARDYGYIAPCRGTGRRATRWLVWRTMVRRGSGDGSRSSLDRDDLGAGSSAAI